MVAFTASFLIGLPSFTCHPLRGIQTVKGTANAPHLYAELSMLNANAFAACGQYVFTAQKVTAYGVGGGKLLMGLHVQLKDHPFNSYKENSFDFH